MPIADDLRCQRSPLAVARRSVLAAKSTVGPSPKARPCHPRLRHLLELRGFVRSAGGIAGAVGMGADTGKLPALHNQILVPDRLAGEVALKDLAHTRGIARLRRERGTGDVRGHAVMRHRPPWM